MPCPWLPGLMVALVCSSAHADGLHDEAYRPQFHFTAEKGWLNDPNGLVFYDGEYHLFHQHNPRSNEWISELSWGHAISKDLVHWRYLPDVLAPLPRADGGAGGSWSGSGFVDWKNTAGFQTGAEKPIILAWTAVGLGQCIAYSNDRGRTFTPYADNPVLPMNPVKKGDWDRDPKVFWHAPTRQWNMVISVTGKGAQVYSSTDLKHWIYQSTFPGLYECPDLFEIALDGRPTQKRWIIQEASGKYFIGRFDGRAFTRESGPYLLDHGRNYYAAQTWSDVPPADGRRISIAWLNGGKYPGMPFNQQMSVPCVLALKSLPEGVRLTRWPVQELDMLRRDGQEWKNEVLRPGMNLLAGVAGDTFDLEAEFELGQAREVDFTVRGETIRYHGSALSCLGKSVDLKPIAGRIKLRILVDRTSVEVFGNDGAVSLSGTFLPPPGDKTLGIQAVDGAARVLSLRVYRMRSAWKKDKD